MSDRGIEVEEEGTDLIACEFHSTAGPRVPCPAGMGTAAAGPADKQLAATLSKLNDPAVYYGYRLPYQAVKTTREGIRAARKIDDLGASVARYVDASGKVTVDAVADAVWALPPNLRGVVIENALSRTQYSRWYHIGQLDRGFFPEVDFALTSEANSPLVSVKTVSPFSERSLEENLPDHVREIVQGEINYIGRGNRARQITLHILMPRNSAIPAENLSGTLRWLIPPDLRRYIKIEISEF